jgi:hypothetical protein
MGLRSRTFVYRTWQPWVLSGMVLALLAYGSWQIYSLGLVNGATELAELRGKYGQLLKRAAALQQTTTELREHAAVLERSSQIDRQASIEVRHDLESLQDELHAAREEIEFYRGIVSPGDGKPGLRIHRFELQPEGNTGVFRFNLVLTQLRKNDRIVQGEVRMDISGHQAGKEVVLKLADVIQSKSGHVQFKFRYFQHLTGNLLIPEGFEPRELLLVIEPSGKKHPPRIEEHFKWPVSGRT